MESRASMQLSVSMIVMLIFSIIIFSGGLYLVKQFFTFAETTEARVSAQAQKEIESRMMQSGEPITIPFNKKKVLVGEAEAFALGILNTYQSSETFQLEVSFSNAFDTINPSTPLVEPDKEFINSRWTFTELPPIENLARNAVSIVPISILAGSEMAPGIATARGTTYVFNVCVYPLKLASPSGLCSVDGQIPRNEIRTQLHGQKIGKIYLDII